jgi:hypothetical protein
MIFVRRATSVALILCSALLWGCGGGGDDVAAVVLTPTELVPTLRTNRTRKLCTINTPRTGWTVTMTASVRIAPSEMSDMTGRAWVAALGLAFLASAAHGHGGGLNGEGCHHNRKTGDYHCHRASLPTGATGAEGSDSVEPIEQCGCSRWQHLRNERCFGSNLPCRTARGHVHDHQEWPKELRWLLTAAVGSCPRFT